MLGVGFALLAWLVHERVNLAVGGLSWYASVMVLTTAPSSLLIAYKAFRVLPHFTGRDWSQQGPWLVVSMLVLIKGLLWTVGEGTSWCWVVLMLEIPMTLLWSWLAERAVPFELTLDTVGIASVETMGEALFLVSPDGRVDYANPAGVRLLGFDPRGRSFAELCPVWPGSGSSTVVRGDGRSVPVVVRAAPMRVHGQAAGHAVSVANVTDMQNALDLAEAARREADRMSRAKQELVAVMSHEIRTPMNAIVGLTHLLAETDLDEQQSEWTQTIRQSSDALLSIVSDVLDFSRIESGRVDFESIVFDPKALLEGAVAVVQHSAEKRGLVLERSFADLPEAVRGDPTRTRQIVLNLLANAVKFTEQGSVRLDVRYQDAQLVVDVADSGIGIAPEVLPHLFDAFTQANASTTRRFGGTGLGLAISHNLARAMGGSLTAESTLGAGSVFHLVIPAPAAVREVTRAVLPVLPGPDTSELKALIVEDNPVNRAVLNAVLRHFAVSSEEASDGLEGVAKALEQAYDIIFVDLHMPGIDGWEALSRIRASAGPDGPFLVSHSANVAREDVERARLCGADEHLPKPATPSDVARMLKLAAERRAVAVAQQGRPAAHPVPAQRGGGVSQSV